VSDKAAMLRETVEGFAELGTMIEELMDEQAKCIRLGVLGVRNLVLRWPGRLSVCDGRASQAADSLHKARTVWAPGSFWGLRYPVDRTGS
jgi:hypothetical protein